MNHWSYKDLHVVFTDREEQALIDAVEPDEYKKAQYRIVSTIGSNQHRDVINKKIKTLLVNRYKSDPKRFREQYEYRHFREKHARAIFPYFLNRYGQLTKIAKFGKYINDYEDPLGFSNLSVSLIDSEEDETYYISILKSRGFLFAKEIYIDNYISFPSSSIELLEGRVTHFVLQTNSMTIIFDKSSIQIRVR